MQQTLFHIPLPTMGAMLAVWGVASGLLMAWLLWKQGFNADTRGYLPLIAMIGAAIYFVLPAVAEPEGLPIRGYGAMLLAGVLAGVGLAVRRACRAGLDQEIILSLAFWMFLAGIIGARLFYVIEYWRHYFCMPGEDRLRPLGEIVKNVLNVTEGGLVVYGALVGGMGAFLVFIWQNRLPGLALADLIAPSMVLGLALGRVGCFLNGCCYGGPSDWQWPLAVTFPRAAPPQQGQAKARQISLHGIRLPRDDAAPAVIEEIEPSSPAAAAGLKPGDHITAIVGHSADDPRAVERMEQVKTAGQAMVGLLKIRGADARLTIVPAGEVAEKEVMLATGEAPLNLPVHPAQLYASIDALLLALFLLAYYPYRRHDGEVVALMLTIHPVTRYLLEVIRIDEADFIKFPASWAPALGTGLSISQTISILLLVVAAGLWAYLLRQPKRLSFYAPSAAPAAA
jgi:phosphatidylglycerol---prolipoprotein diacylglyceryl transferase